MFPKTQQGKKNKASCSCMCFFMECFLEGCCNSWFWRRKGIWKCPETGKRRSIERRSMPGPWRSLHLGSNLTLKRASTETQRVALRSVCSKEPGTFEAQSFEPLMEVRSVECGFTVSPCHDVMPVGLIEPRDDPACWALAFNSGPDYALQVGPF